VDGAIPGREKLYFYALFLPKQESNYSYMKYLLCFVLFFPVLFSCNTGSTSPAVDTGDTSANRWVKPAGKDSLLLLTNKPPNSAKYSVFDGVLHQQNI
jgi:hypothetical protein